MNEAGLNADVIEAALAHSDKNEGVHIIVQYI
jgi:hypothetical protein